MTCLFLTPVLTLDDRIQAPNGRMNDMIAPLLPSKVTESPMLLETEVAPVPILSACARAVTYAVLTTARPGNAPFDRRN
eukprot:2365029-Rhodomonas_salina.1